MGRLRLVIGRAALARYLAPVAFLLAVTAVVLVVRSTLHSDRPSIATTTRNAETRPAPARTGLTPPTPKRYYVIQSGDTLGAIAGRFATTVAELERLNPGIEPTALRPGEQIRVR